VGPLPFRSYPEPAEDTVVITDVVFARDTLASGLDAGHGSRFADRGTKPRGMMVGGVS
jgi:hypothetical protein